MTMTSIRVGASRRPPSGIAGALLELLASAAERRRIRKELKELSRLPRHLLRDVGLEHYAEPVLPAKPNNWW